MQQEKKKLGMFDIYALGVGGAVGSGIFVMMGLGIGYTGRSIFLAVSIGCVYMLLAYLFHPVMASMFILPGGEYDMKAMLFNPTLTGVSAVFTVINGFGLSMYALAIVDYAGMIFPGIVPYAKVIAIMIITLFFAATIRGSKFVALLSDIMTVILLITIALFVIMGLPKVQSGFFDCETLFMNGKLGFIQAISIMSFTCQGTTMTPISMMATTKKPKRTIPTAIIFIVITVALVYALMSIVASGVLPIEDVVGQNLALVAQTIFPHWLYVIFILGGAVCAIATSLIGVIAMLRYPIYQVALDGWLPPVFSKTTKNGYPYVIQLVFYFVAIFPILLNFSMDGIVSMVMVPSMLMNVYLNAALIKMIKEYPEQWKKSMLHMPDGIFSVVAIVSSLCAFAVAYSLFGTMRPVEKITLIVMIVGCAAVALLRLKTGAVKKEDLIIKRQEIAERALKLGEEAES